MKPLFVITAIAVCDALVGESRNPSLVMIIVAPSFIRIPLKVVNMREDSKLGLRMCTVPPPRIKPSGLPLELLVNGPAMRSSEPEATYQACELAAEITIGRLMMLIPAVLVNCTAVPLSVSRLPLSEKPPLLKAIQPRERLAMLLTLAGWTVPLKMALSLFVGAVPPQLLAVAQFASAPPPVHVRLAACSSRVGMQTVRTDTRPRRPAVRSILFISV